MKKSSLYILTACRSHEAGVLFEPGYLGVRVYPGASMLKYAPACDLLYYVVQTYDKDFVHLGYDATR